MDAGIEMRDITTYSSILSSMAREGEQWAGPVTESVMAVAASGRVPFCRINWGIPIDGSV